MTKKTKTSTHLFIDTNVFLNFYAYSNDDLEQLTKLVEILKTKAIKLYVTQQVVDEFYRNRDSRLSESFDKFRPFGNETCPRFMTGLPEHKAFSITLTAYKDARKLLQEKARAQADSRELLADRLFSRIVEQSKVIAIDNDAYAQASRRARLGNPPGKSAVNIGDQLNWELLLANVPNGSDLHVITKDSDYSSTLDPSQPKMFLRDEWEAAKQANLRIYEQISLFFKNNYPDEEFSLEIEKRESIDAFTQSGNFASTHLAIVRLNPYVDFLTPEEAEEVMQGALSNNQIAWIASDSDVEGFLRRMHAVHGQLVSPTLMNRLNELLDPATGEISDPEIDEEQGDPPF
jgi:predicted nucleic acid-binding protein